MSGAAALALLTVVFMTPCIVIGVIELWVGLRRTRKTSDAG